MKVSAEVCPLCEGTGWKTVAQGTDTQAVDRRVARCDCELRRRAQTLLAAARIPKRYEHCELSNFEYDGAHIKVAPARMAAWALVDDYPVATGLMFVGRSGLGKTHLAVGILKALTLEKGAVCLFSDYRELLKQIQNSYNSSVQATELGILQPVFDVEVLVLDDLGAVKPTEWVWDTVSLILNTRYNDNRTTIITTNFEDERWQDPYADDSSESARARKAGAPLTLGDRIGERMRSRLHEMCRVVRMDGKDFRETMLSATLRHAARLGEPEIAVSCADCPKCGKEYVHKRVGALRTQIRSSLRMTITCKQCGHLFSVARQDLQIRRKSKKQLEAEYSLSMLEIE